MKMKHGAILLAVLTLLAVGCATRYGQRLEQLDQELQAGTISEAEYQDELRKLREAQPWGTEPEAYQGPRARGTMNFP